MNIIVGMMMPLMNCARKLAWYSVVVALGEEPVGLLLAAEHLDQLVAGEGLLDDAVDLAGALPLLHEVLLAALADHRGDHHGDRDRHERDAAPAAARSRTSSRSSRRR